MQYKHLFTNEREARALLTYLTEPGDRVVAAAVRDYTAEGAIEFLLEDHHAAGSPNLEAAVRLLSRLDGRHPMVDVLQEAATRGVYFITPDDPEFPITLKAEGLDGIGDAAPVGLWVKGRPLALGLDDKPLAFVGARAATSYGEHVTQELVTAAVRRGHTIVSGGAYGIDGAAHRTALMCGGRTVVFLAGGVERPYPTGHSDLFERVQVNGTLVSEVPPESAPTKYRFLQRNRLIAAASQGMVVVEAGIRSGSLNAADHAAEFCVPLMAVPGPIMSAASAGTNHIISQGRARLVTSFDDIEKELDR